MDLASMWFFTLPLVLNEIINNGLINKGNLFDNFLLKKISQVGYTIQRFSLSTFEIN